VELVRGAKSAELERVGVSTDSRDLMGLKVERVELPVEPGRDVAGLIELAAINFKLRTFGYNSAVEFDQRLLKKMSDDQLG
jgi:HPr kinase/phosphorylase